MIMKKSKVILKIIFQNKIIGQLFIWKKERLNSFYILKEITEILKFTDNMIVYIKYLFYFIF